jgi:4-amino-4-deoxychorismate lyase
MYNSRIQGIIKDPVLMSISIDDHMVHRGHSVFDTCSVINGKAYNLRRHLQRLFSSAEKAKIEISFTLSFLEKSILDLAASTQEPNLFIRYWMSSGPGNMEIHPVPNSTTFYGIAYKSIITERFRCKNEFFVSVPTKPKLLANMKSNNYMLNALCAMESQAKGGANGIQINPDGSIAEGSINNVVFLLKGKVLVTPPYDLILQGTTLERILIFANRLVDEGVICSVQQRSIFVEEVKDCLEAFNVGGDAISSLISIDGKMIGDGSEGDVYKRLKEMLFNDFDNPDLTIQVPYELYQ